MEKNLFKNKKKRVMDCDDHWMDELKANRN